MPPDAGSLLTVTHVRNDAELMQCLAIREVVFIEEQHVPASLERDAEDARAYHVIAHADGHAVGTGRLVRLASAPAREKGTWGQIGRMAVLQANRRGGTGSKLLEALENEARKEALDGILLHAQLSALEFYQHHGYQPHGPVFQEAGLPHLEMKKHLTSHSDGDPR
ncbi:MAG: GNAT family N-acetyltransferase [Myxococcaceae bacterium]